MKKIWVLLTVALVGAGVALTYHIFENAVHESINLVWYDWFNTNTNRLFVIPLTLVLTMTFFGLQHYLDKISENKEEHGLGEMPAPTIKNYLKVLLIGYFSLLAGASLGPEAILVPASMILGAYIGSNLFKNSQIAKLMSAAGIMALFTAFFSSFFVGVLSLALVIKQAKIKLSPMLLIVAAISSASSYLMLKLVSANAYLDLPSYSWHLSLKTIVLSMLLVVFGIAIIFALSFIDKAFLKIKEMLKQKPWWLNAIIAAAGISLFYLVGGHLVEFTGNLSIEPMFEESANLGLTGLVWILIIKTAVIGWSKAIGYRGGMIFPTVFLAAVLVAILQLYAKDLNAIYGLIAVLVGAFIANSKTRVLV